MNAGDVMTTDVATVGTMATVQDVAKILLERRVSGVPVVDPEHHVLGIISEGDLIRRVETNTIARGSWWLGFFGAADQLQEQFIKSHGRTVDQVMTRDPVTVSPDTPLREIAALLEKKGIKRVPVVENGKLVGIVSRANLLHGLGSATPADESPRPDDRGLRELVTKTVQNTPGLRGTSINVLVHDGSVELWGYVQNDTEERAIIVAVQEVPGVEQIQSHLGRSTGWWYGI